MFGSVDFISRREIVSCSRCKMQYMLLAVYVTCSILVFVLVEHKNEEANELVNEAYGNYTTYSVYLYG